MAATALSFSFPAWAQQQPDAGQIVQDLKEAPTLPTESSMPALSAPKDKRNTNPGGSKVKVKNVIINGNSLYEDEQLLSLLGDIDEQSYDLAGLKDLADKITAFYHENDYPFAHAIVPAQSMKNGNLKIEVIEGHYGDIFVDSTEYTEQAEAFLSHLQLGDVIKGGELERASLILDDQPGYSVMPVIRPGKDIGAGDLSFNMKKDEPFGGSVRVDNHGNRYTGRGRVQANLYANSPLMFGDQINASAIYSEEQMWYGSFSYSLPISRSGLRGNIGFKHTDYELGKEFKSLDAHGTADILSAGVSYPIIRSQKENLSLAISYQHKWLTDEQDSTNSEDKKTSDVVPVVLNFDKRDALFGGGVIYGALSWTHGTIDLDEGLAATDRTTASTDGSFDKVNLDVSRAQALPVKNLSLYARLSGQKAFNNLDSSEDFGLGGPTGVRAYPTGESYGDEGALGQIELRYVLNDMATPYVFYDQGRIKTNQNPWTTADNDRTIAGAGLGIRADYKGWSTDAAAAWRTIGGKPESDSRDYVPMLWLNASYKF